MGATDIHVDVAIISSITICSIIPRCASEFKVLYTITGKLLDDIVGYHGNSLNIFDDSMDKLECLETPD